MIPRPKCESRVSVCLGGAGQSNYSAQRHGRVWVSLKGQVWVHPSSSLARNISPLSVSMWSGGCRTTPSWVPRVPTLTSTAKDYTAIPTYLRVISRLQCYHLDRKIKLEGKKTNFLDVSRLPIIIIVWPGNNQKISTQPKLQGLGLRWTFPHSLFLTQDLCINIFLFARSWCDARPL